MNSRKFNYILIIFWLIISVITMFHHELWRDEARVWGILTENIKTAFSFIANDGHPFLWYILVYPFVKLKANPFIMQILSLIAVSVSVGIICLKSKINIINKILLIFSFGMIYFLPVNARNYSLVPLFLFLLAQIYPKRAEKPFLFTIILILLSQTHALIWGLCFITGCIFSVEQLLLYKNIGFKEKLKKYLPVFTLIVYFILMFFIYKFNNREAQKAFSTISPTLFSNIKDIITANLLLHVPDNIKQMYFISAVFLSLAILKANYKAFLILVFSIFFMLFVFGQVWAGGILAQKFSLFILVFVFCCLILPETSKFNNITVQSALCLFLIFTNYIFNPVELIKTDINKKITNTEEVCKIINNIKLNKNEYLIMDEGWIMPDTFLMYGISIDNYLIINNYEYGENQEEYKRKIFEKLKQNNKIKYIIINEDIDYLNKIGNFEQIYKINKDNEGIIGLYTSQEFYNIYRVIGH